MTMIERIKEILTEHSQAQQLLKRVAELSPSESLSLTGIAGSLRSFVLSAIADDASKQLLVVAVDEDETQKLRDDLNLVTSANRVRLFGGAKPHSHVEEASATSVEDIETLRALIDGNANIIVTHATELTSNLPNPNSLSQRGSIHSSRKPRRN